MMKVTSYKTMPIQGRRKAAHAYFFLTGESILENLVNRRSRPTKEYKKLLWEILKKEGYTEHEVSRITWSQTCGCSCKCSPGFRIEGIYGKDFFIDVENV
jgi:hypothetical protein